MGSQTKDRVLLTANLEMNSSLLFLAVPVFIIGIVSTFVGFGLGSFTAAITGLVFLLIAFLLMFHFERIEVDCRRGTLRKYKDYVIFKPGAKYDLQEYAKVTIEYETSSGGGSIRGAQTNWNQIKYKHYNIFIERKDKKKFFLKEFSNHKSAIDFQNRLCLASKLEGISLIERPKKQAK